MIEKSDIVLDNALRHVMAQFYDETAQSELRDMGPSGFDWVTRTEQTIEILMPRLVQIAQNIKTDLPAKLNAASHIRKELEGGKKFVEGTKEAKEWFRRMLEISGEAESLIGNLESQQISAEIQRYINERALSDLVFQNGNSIYPDLLLKSHSYEGLPKQSRKNPIDGPCLRGDRPSNVPDGCEIKTNRSKKVKVDAHGAHPGLHFAVTWNFCDEGAVEINGVWAAYIKSKDHRESGRNVKVTTVKYSFGHNLFVSLLPAGDD